MGKAGKSITRGSYKTFQPILLSDDIKIDNAQVNTMLADAMRYLGELNAYSQLVPNIDYFIRMHIAKEATQSNKIEGTRTNLAEVIQDDEEALADLDSERRDDLEEVRNYIKAVNYAVAQMRDLPIANRLITQTHKVLLSGVRGFTRAPGEIRKVQNWIGGGNSIHSAVFIPPSPDTLSDLLSNTEHYWHEDNNIPDLIKMALVHYQFETIHPFLDGNGRMGRLLISLQLIDKKILTKPALYISDYFERHRADYYDSLERVRKSGDYTQWVKFFLAAMLESARDAKQTLSSIVSLQDSYDKRLLENGLSATRQKRSRDLITCMYGQPIMTIKQIKEATSSSWQTASDLATKLEEIGILKEITGDEKSRKYMLHEYFALFEEKGTK